MAESPDERYVRTKLEARFGLQLRKLPEQKHKTADFEMILGGQRLAVIEVKTIEHTPRTPENGFTQKGRFLTRLDNSPRRVAALIHDGWKQLKSYDGMPKVLAFVNDESGADIDDLHEAIHGLLIYGTKETGYLVNTASAKLAEGRIKDEKWRIDLYIWFDRIYEGGRIASVFPAGKASYEETRTAGPLFRCTSTAGYELGRTYMQFEELADPDSIAPHQP